MKINKYGPAHDTARCTLVYPWRPAATDISNRYEALSKRRVFELEREEFQPEARSNQQRATGIMISYWAVYEEFNSVFFIEGCKITKGPPVQVSGGSWSTSRLYQAMLWITWENLTAEEMSLRWVSWTNSHNSSNFLIYNKNYKYLFSRSEILEYLLSGVVCCYSR